MKHINEPKQLGEIMREHFIIDANNNIDHDMIITLFNIHDHPKPTPPDSPDSPLKS